MPQAYHPQGNYAQNLAYRELCKKLRGPKKFSSTAEQAPKPFKVTPRRQPPKARYIPYTAHNPGGRSYPYNSKKRGW